MDERPPDLPPDPYPPPAPDPYGAYAATPPAPPTPPERPPLPFEDKSIPWFTGMVQTIVLLARRPREAFERMSVTGDLLRPVIFALVLGSLGYILSSVWQLALGDMMARFMPQTAEYDAAMSRNLTIWLMACSPFIVLMSLLLSTVFYHLFLMLFGAAKGGIATTLRVLCYSYASMVAYVIPGCGSILGGVWLLVLEIIGFSAAHKTTTGRAALAVLVPIFLACACVGVVFMLFGAAIMAQMKH